LSRSLGAVPSLSWNSDVTLIGKQQLRAERILPSTTGAPGKDKHDVPPELRHLPLIPRAQAFAEPYQ
jgi:hypothetical protein